MRDSLDLGAVPADEACEQLGADYRPARAMAECRAFIAQLRRTFGEEQGTARLRVAYNQHDFGTYLSVECTFDDGDETGMDYAYRVEANCPTKWDSEARADLGLEAR